MTKRPPQPEQYKDLRITQLARLGVRRCQRCWQYLELAQFNLREGEIDYREERVAPRTINFCETCRDEVQACKFSKSFMARRLDIREKLVKMPRNYQQALMVVLIIEETLQVSGMTMDKLCSRRRDRYTAACRLALLILLRKRARYPYSQAAHLLLRDHTTFTRVLQMFDRGESSADLRHLIRTIDVSIKKRLEHYARYPAQRTQTDWLAKWQSFTSVHIAAPLAYRQ